MALRLSTPCPSCQSPMKVAGIECPQCNTHIQGLFEQNEFLNLTQEMLQFVRVFIWCEGNIREIEKSLGLSYPTVKARINELKSSLFQNESIQNKESAPQAKDLTEILNSIESGNQSADEAIDQLKAQLKIRKKNHASK